MNIALPILLLVFGSLSFWVLSESSVKWYFRTACISLFCSFTVIFWLSIHTFLGWPALESSMPEKMSVHWIVIKEPNKNTGFKGKIYVLSESIKNENDNFLARIFGYGTGRIEPRLYGLKYSRGLHERLEKGVMQRLRSGVPVMGRFTRIEDRRGKAKGEGEGLNEENGGGSESQEQEWEFHELLPSEIHSKPER